jgi:hypothetical protein
MANSNRGVGAFRMRARNPDALYVDAERNVPSEVEADTLRAEWRTQGFARVTVTRVRGVGGWFVRGYRRASEWTA